MQFLKTLILFNESFTATNEREGSEIATQIVDALFKENIQVFFVTHVYEFARRFYSRGMPQCYLLASRAKRN